MERLRRFQRTRRQHVDVSRMYGTITLYDPTQQQYADTGDRWLCASEEDNLDRPEKVLSIYRVISGYNGGARGRGRDISRFLSVLCSLASGKPSYDFISAAPNPLT